MRIYFDTNTGAVTDISENISQRKIPLDSGENYINVPDDTNLSKSIYQLLGNPKLKVLNNVLTFDNASMFTFSGLQSYLRRALLEGAEQKIQFMRVIQLIYVLSLKEKFERGDTINYPITLINPSNSNKVIIGSNAQLNDALGVLLDDIVDHLGSVINVLANKLEQVKNANTVQDLGGIKL